MLLRGSFRIVVMLKRKFCAENFKDFDGRE